MLIPIILAITSAVMFAATNHIDKYLISKAVKNADYRALILVSAIIAGSIMSLVYLVICRFEVFFDWQSILILLLNSALYLASLVLYYKALNREDTTIVIIMFQLIPVFMLFISPLFLKDQTIGPLQLVGGLITTLAAIFVTYEPEKKKFDKGRLITFAMMAVVSLIYSVWYILIRYVNQDHDFNQTTFWSSVTLFTVGVLIFIFSKTFRRSFTKMLKSNGKKVISLNLLNEVLNTAGGVVSTFAGTMASVALVSFVSQGVQPFAVMIIGIIITKLSPKIEKEKITKKETIKRIITLIFCIIGLACIEFG